MKDKEDLSHRYKLTRSVNRVLHPNQPRPHSDSEETQPKEVIKAEPINPPAVIANPREPDFPNPLDREVDMDQQRIEAVAMEMIGRGELNHLFDQHNVNERRGQGNGNRDRNNRQHDRNERTLRYSFRDIPTFDGKGDAMPHTHLIEFEDFLRRVAKELGYNADQNLDVFSCCVPSHLYLYLKGATTIKEAMENIKRACALGGVQYKLPQLQ